MIEYGIGYARFFFSQKALTVHYDCVESQKCIIPNLTFAVNS